MSDGERTSGASRPLGDRYERRQTTTLGKIALAGLTVAVPLALWDKRGAAVAVIAAFSYGILFGLAVLTPRPWAEWSRRHVVLDALIVVPLMFVALAYITNMSLVLCVVVALGTAAVTVPLAVRRRGAHRTS